MKRIKNLLAILIYMLVPMYMYAQTVLVPENGKVYNIVHSSGYYLGSGGSNAQILLPSSDSDQQFKFVLVENSVDVYNIQQISTGRYLIKSGSYDTAWGTDPSINVARFRVVTVDETQVKFQCLDNSKFLGTDDSTVNAVVYSDKTSTDVKHYWKIYFVPNASVDMKYIQSVATYNTRYVNTNTTNNVLMSLAIKTKNQENALSLKNLNLSAAGTTSLSNNFNIKIYVNSEASFSATNLVKTLSAPTTETFDVPLDYSLSSGMNYFWVTCDIPSGIAQGNELHMSCNNFTLNDSVIVPTTSSIPGKLIVDPSKFIVINNAKLPIDIVTTTGGNGSGTSDGTNFVSFQQNAITTYKGYQYVVYWTPAFHVCISRKKMPEGTWEPLELPDYTTSSGHLSDGHYDISLGICENDGTMHLAFDHHGNTLHYRMSVPGIANNPDSADWLPASFKAVRDYLVEGSSISMVTYPRFVQKPNGDMLYECRLGSSGNGNNLLWEYKASTGKWTSIGQYANGVSVSENPYINGIHYDPQGRLHVSWVWRQTPDAQTNHDICYIYSDDDGRTWNNAAGTKIGTVESSPVTLTSPGLIVMPMSTNRGLINQESQTVDSKGKIHILQSYIPEGVANTGFWDSRINNGELHHIYQDENGTWQSDMIAPSTRNRSQIAVDRNDNLYVVGAGYRVYCAKAADKWQVWNAMDLTESGTIINEGLIDRELLLKENVLSFVFAKKGGAIMVPYYLLDNMKPGTGNGLNVKLYNDSIISSGVLETQYAEAYELYLTASGNTTMWVNGKQVISIGNISSPTEFQTTLKLLPTHKYEIVIKTSSAATKLEWSSKSQMREIVPLALLYSVEVKIPSAIISTKDEANIQCYPNPFKSTFTLKANDAFEYFVFSTNGKLIKSGRGENSCVLGGNLEKGVYFIQVIQNKEIKTSKLIKL